MEGIESWLKIGKNIEVDPREEDKKNAMETDGKETDVGWWMLKKKKKTLGFDK